MPTRLLAALCLSCVFLACAAKDEPVSEGNDTGQDNGGSGGDTGALQSPADDGSAGADPLGAGGAGGAGAMPEDPGSDSALTPISDTVSVPAGGHCETVAECPTGLDCLLEEPDFFGGTIAGGLCTTSCAADANACANYPGTGCIRVANGSAFCLELCQIADGQYKCQGQYNQLCAPLDDTIGPGACLPRCFDDLECPESMFCDPASGLCVADEPQGGAFGSVCTVDEDCVGNLCLLVTEDEGFCSGVCSFTGLVGGCGYDYEGSDAAPALCLPAVQNGGLLDPGFCNPTCDSDADCQFDELECVLFEDADTEEAVGALGTCLLAAEPAAPEPAAEPEPTAEPEPSADAAAPVPAADAGAADAGAP